MKRNLTLLAASAILITCLGSYVAFAEDGATTEPSHLSPKEIAEITENPSEINPFDPNINQLLQEFDRVYEEETGIPAHLEGNDFFGLNLFSQKCVRQSCPIFVQIIKSTQTLHLFREGQLIASWAVSTGLPSYETPNLDKNPDGRIYDRYSSKKYPGGDYKGLGNMPYAVFIWNGFAIHGTPQSNWKYLGKKASHGCIRVHPDNAQYLNRLVREYGIRNVWITIQN